MSMRTLNVVYNRQELGHNDMAIIKNNGKLFIEFIEEYINKCHRSVAYKQMYFLAVKHLTGFSEANDILIYTHSVSEQRLEEFVYYLQDNLHLMISTVKGMVERVKCMLQKAYNCGYKVDGTFRDFNVRDEEIDTIFLSMTDIARIYYFGDLTLKQSEVRDYFIIGCLTGLRYSDYSRLAPENFADGKIVIRTKKTKTPVQIPMHPFVKEIIKKYDGVLPKARCIQYFNHAIKDICQKVGFLENLPYERRIGLEFISVMRPKYTFVSSHTARRSAATNMFLAGIPTYRVMLLTGHKTESAFFRYIRITREENAITLSGHQFFN